MSQRALLYANALAYPARVGILAIWLSAIAKKKAPHGGAVEDSYLNDELAFQRILAVLHDDGLDRVGDELAGICSELKEHVDVAP